MHTAQQANAIETAKGIMWERLAQIPKYKATILDLMNSRTSTDGVTHGENMRVRNYALKLIKIVRETIEDAEWSGLIDHERHVNEMVSFEEFLTENRLETGFVLHHYSTI